MSGAVLRMTPVVGWRPCLPVAFLRTLGNRIYHTGRGPSQINIEDVVESINTSINALVQIPLLTVRTFPGNE